MDLLIAFLLFAAAMAASLIVPFPMLAALGAGLVFFAAVGLHRGFSPRDLLRMALRGCRKGMIVLRVFVLIGLITASWRASGTIAFFVYHGVRLIPPALFLTVAFLLTALLAFALGTSFGVTGTVGVILMAVARSSGVPPLLTAGAVLSGAYFGDRSAPSSSSANLVAAITETRLYDNVRMMLRTGALPFALAAAGYLALSLRNPIRTVDASMTEALRQSFSLSLLTALPALLMLVLPLCRVGVRWAMGASFASALALAVFLQRLPLAAALRCCVFGYQPAAGPLAAVLAGGGLLSMARVAGIVLLSCAYSGIFDGTRMLSGVQNRLDALCGRIGLAGSAAAVSLAACAVFCNQTVGVMMVQQLLGPAYRARGASGGELAADLENTCIVLVGLIPWSIACAVPLEMLGVGPGALPYAFYLWLLPLCWLLTKRRFYPKAVSAAPGR